MQICATKTLDKDSFEKWQHSIMLNAHTIFLGKMFAQKKINHKAGIASFLYFIAFLHQRVWKDWRELKVAWAREKILLVPPKYEIIMVPSIHSFFQYCDSKIGKTCKVITLNPLCIFFFCITSLLLFWWLSL